MIEIAGSEVIGKCKLCGNLVTSGAKHYLINRGLHLYYICEDCYKDIVEVRGNNNDGE